MPAAGGDVWARAADGAALDSGYARALADARFVPAQSDCRAVDVSVVQQFGGR